jgi:3-oxoacyl-[acyl-carrier-protein] synthase-3
VTGADSVNSIGRQVRISDAAIAGVVSCIPSNVVHNSSFFEKFGESSVNDVVKMIGVEQRRWSGPETSTRDLCSAAAKRLISGLGWSTDSIDALIFVSQTPDYVLPATSCVLHAELGLPKSAIAFDVNLGCSGYPYAVWLGMTLIQTGAANRVILAVGDTISKITDPGDRATTILFGDAGTVTGLEAAQNKEAFFILGTDGNGASNLIVPSGAFKDYSQSGDPRLLNRKSDCLFMDGGEVFNFTLRAVPDLVNKTIEFSHWPKDSYDYFLFHQANLFMLKHLAKKLKIANEKAPTNIEEYGNTSCASIPLLITTRLKERLLAETLNIGMFGFGVGYSWASASLQVGPLKYIETIEI